MNAVLAILLALGCVLALPIYAWLLSAPFARFRRKRRAGNARIHGLR